MPRLTSRGARLSRKPLPPGEVSVEGQVQTQVQSPSCGPGRASVLGLCLCEVWPLCWRRPLAAVLQLLVLCAVAGCGLPAGHHLGVTTAWTAHSKLLLLTQQLAAHGAPSLEVGHSPCACASALTGHQSGGRHEQHVQKPALLHSGACSLQHLLCRRWPLPGVSCDQ